MKMKRKKTAGIDGIPAEFWQNFEFLDEWLEQVFEAARQQKRMSHTMRIAVVKVIFKKKDRRKFENYRPLSMLCTDYKLLAKILTERMKEVLPTVVQNDQQGFIKDGDITGNLILVKEIIEYCEEEEMDGAIIMMDFMKAYDRVDRDVMFEVLKAMNFGEEFVEYVKMMYKDVTAKIEINGELTDEVETTRGVRQGCPLSPLLFICVLELMAIEIRNNDSWEGIREPNSGEEDKISLFADDSAGMLAKPNEQMKEARESVEKYEKATDAKLHDTKTKIMPLGKTRQNLLPKKQLQVEFDIMEEKDREAYLGDLVGHGITEKERFSGGLKKMEEIGNQWKRENVTVYGKAVIFNVLMIAGVKYRAGVNPISKDMKKELHELARSFIWDQKRSYVKWERLIQKREDGGIGLRDPGCDLDAAKIRMFRNMRVKRNQPWVKWIKRKEQRLKKKWEVEGSIYAHTPTHKQKKEMNEKCLFEQTLKIWYEVGGTTRYDYERKLTNRKMKKQEEKRKQKRKEERKEEKRTQQKEEEKEKMRYETNKRAREETVSALNNYPLLTQEIANGFQQILTILLIEEEMSRQSAEEQKQRTREILERIEREEQEEAKEREAIDEIGMEVEGGWMKLEWIETKQIYAKLKEARYGEMKEQDKKTNHGTTTLYDRLHPNERQFWWRCAHRIIQTNSMKAKWLADENGKMNTNRCPMCKTDKETWSHMEYECKALQTFMKELEYVYDEYMKDREKCEQWTKPTVDEWRLEEKKMNSDKMYVIAKARWIYHGERCKMMKKGRKRVDIDVVMDKVRDELNWTREKEREHREKEREEEKKKRQKKQDELLNKIKKTIRRSEDMLIKMTTEQKLNG